MLEVMLATGWRGFSAKGEVTGVGAPMDWLVGLGVNLASTGVWEVIRCAYDLCTEDLKERHATEEVLTAAAQQVVHEAQLGRGRSAVADRF